MHRVFEENGFVVTAPLFDPEECDAIARNVTTVNFENAGTRNLLTFPWCVSLVRLIRSHPAVAPLLPGSAVASQCTLFEKSVDRNWLVSLHQDLSIPVAGKVEHPDIAGWSVKEGTVFAQPPTSLLAGLVAVRLHLDDCGSDDGPLRVVPGSHRSGRLDCEVAIAKRQQLGEMICAAPRGSAVLMRPLLLHASSKSSSGNRRRVLHFLFGPSSLPFGLKWGHAV
jgi:ectoine hydroxylase-related dioxygenase (phytanoyl-CoA dioxygenase family)